MADPIKGIDLYHFNDFHRHLEPREDGSGGASRLSSLIRKAREGNPDAVVLNGGDVCGDHARTFDPMADVFNRMGVDVLGLGNHEFEDPEGNYKQLREGLIEPFRGEVLCANVTQADGRPLEGTKPYTIRHLAGLDVAFIGVVTTDLASAVFPAAGAGLAVSGMEATLQELVPKVRAEGADAVVVLSHESLRETKKLAGKVPGVDVMLAAHDHRITPEPERVEGPDGPTWVAEAGGYGTHLGHLRMQVAGGRVVGVEGRMIPVTADLPPDPEIEALLEAWPGVERVEIPAGPKRRWESVKLEDLKDRLFGGGSIEQQEDKP